MKLQLPHIRLSAPVKLILKLVISATIIILVVRKIDERLLLDVLKELKPVWIVWAILWFMISKLISAFRFNVLLKTEGIRVPVWKNVRLYWLCMYYNLLLPGGISGDGYKIKLLMDAFEKPFKRIFKITLMDRLSGLFALVQLSLILLLYVTEFRTYWFLIVPAFLLSFFVSWLVFKWMIGKNGLAWIFTTLQSIGVQGAQSIATLGLVFSLGQGMFWPDYLVLFLVSSVVAMLPITIGGAGARELTFLYGSQFLEIHAEKAVAIGFLFYLISTSVSLMGLIFSFKKNDLRNLKNV
ncbi:MAG: lysylphosphatidylglycerol synthase transmembrane domain-containing protein [Saprospiraceae bacterium]